MRKLVKRVKDELRERMKIYMSDASDKLQNKETRT